MKAVSVLARVLLCIARKPFLLRLDEDFKLLIAIWNLFKAPRIFHLPFINKKIMDFIEINDQGVLCIGGALRMW